MSLESFTTEGAPTLDLGLDGGAPPVPVADAPVVPAAPPAELQQLSETFGGDFTSFSSVEDAQRAARLIAESYARAGINYSTNVPPQPVQSQFPNSQVPTNVLPAPTPEDWEGVDPKIAARLQKFERELQQSQQQVVAYQQAVAQQQAAAQQREHQEIFTRATAAIDSLSAPEFGSAGGQTWAQQSARQRVLATADYIVDGMRAANKPVPTIEKVIDMAALIELGRIPTRGNRPAQPAPTAPPAQRAGLGAEVPGATRRRTGTETDHYLADPGFMDGGRAILAKNRGAVR